MTLVSVNLAISIEGISEVSSRITYPHFRNIPVLDGRIRGLVVPLEVDTFHCGYQLCLRNATGPSSLPWRNRIFASCHLYGLNCHACPVVKTQTTRSLLVSSKSTDLGDLLTRRLGRTSVKSRHYPRHSTLSLHPLFDQLIFLPNA